MSARAVPEPAVASGLDERSLWAYSSVAALSHASLRRIRSACSSMKFTTLTLAMPLVAGLLLSGCGHPASETECKELAEHIARLRLQGRGFDEAEVNRRLAEAEQDPEYQKTMEGCVGKRITESSLACVRNAKSPEEIKTKCAR